MGRERERQRGGGSRAQWIPERGGIGGPGETTRDSRRLVLKEGRTVEERDSRRAVGPVHSGVCLCTVSVRGVFVRGERLACHCGGDRSLWSLGSVSRLALAVARVRSAVCLSAPQEPGLRAGARLAGRDAIEVRPRGAASAGLGRSEKTKNTGINPASRADGARAQYIAARSAFGGPRRALDCGLDSGPWIGPRGAARWLGPRPRQRRGAGEI